MPSTKTPKFRQARPAREAVPPLPPLAQLDKTHRKILQMLGTMYALLSHLDELGLDASASQQAEKICTFFANTGRKHHADEEALVFPALLRAGNADLTQQVLRLQQDHGWLEEDWMELEPQLQSVVHGYTTYDLDSLRQAVSIFTTLYYEHIALEDSMIYPLARRQLEADAASRAQRIAAVAKEAANDDAKDADAAT